MARDNFNYDLLANIFSPQPKARAPQSGGMLPKADQDVLANLFSTPGLGQAPGSGVMLPPQQPDTSGADAAAMNYLTAIPGVPTNNANSPMMPPALQQEYSQLAQSQAPAPQMQMPRAPAPGRRAAPQPQNPAAPILDMVQPKQSSVADMFNEFMKRSTEGLDAQRGGIKALEDELAGLKGQGSNPWVQALMGMSDTVNNTNFLQTYAQREEEKKRQALGLAEKIQGARNAVTDKELDLFKTQWSQSSAEEKMQQEREKMLQDRELGLKRIDQDKYNTDSAAAIARYKEENEAKKTAAGKTLTSSETEQLADLKNQLSSLDSIYKDWEGKKLGVRSSGAGAVLDYASNKIAGWSPNSTTSEYRDNLRQKAQMIGKALEGGKLTDVDYTKYLEFLPQETDTPERAKSRIRNLETALRNAYEQRIKTFGEAGYNTGGFTGLQQAATASPINDPGFAAWKKSKGL